MYRRLGKALQEKVGTLYYLIRVKFRDHSRQNKARLKLELELYVNNHVPINQDVSSNTNNF